MDILALFCDLDDFCQAFVPVWNCTLLPSPDWHRNRSSRLSSGEIMTLLVASHDSHYRTFKHLYCRHVRCYWCSEFPNPVSYSRFVEQIPSVLVPLGVYLHTRLGKTQGIACIDSLPLPVCHKLRIPTHKDFAGLAQRGKSSVDWFYGFNLHLINDRGDLLSLRLTPGNVDNRMLVPELAAAIWGKLFGDRGYVSQALFEQLWAKGVQLITKIKRNMKNKLSCCWINCYCANGR